MLNFIEMSNGIKEIPLSIANARRPLSQQIESAGIQL
jgi:hypothetical protein